ncbi:MAG: aldehyde dehydrogenase [Clostridiales bacterium]|jgi:aldehyde dehydrogenase (NAD+)|nr:aldehyde dehydrogenase [Clostridiales bacterium]
MHEFSTSEIETTLQDQRNFFSTGVTKSVPFRKMALQRLYDTIQRKEASIYLALKSDLNKSETESRLTETSMVLQEIRFVLRHLSHWVKPHIHPSAISQMPGVSFSFPEPYGSVLILSPWNYPFQLNLLPLVDALAAGNCAVLKPSEHAPHTAAILTEIIRECFPPKYVAVMPGGQETSEQLLEQPFDFIFFTGGQRVGKIVMEKAAKHLTPVCLELGGKSPCIVDDTADIRLAAKRIAFGKILNAGQTCVAPDYVLVHESVQQPFIAYLSYYFKKSLRNPKDYPKIATSAHFHRLVRQMEHGHIAFGGACNAETQQIAPTILYPVELDSPVMEEEIFGPILPILPYQNLREAVAFIKERPKPLALYLFSQNRLNQACVLNRVSFGGGCINDTILHLASPYLGFGGVGNSGMGSYHGKVGFDTFSHTKNILKKSNHFDFPFRYPPYGKLKQALLKKIL